MRKALTLFIKAAISGLLLYFTLAAVNIGTVMSRLGHVDARWAVLGLLFLVVQLAALAWRWQLVVVRCGADLPFARLFRLSMIGVFFNQTLPSSAGGDAVRIWLLGKQSTWRIAAYSVLLDRVIGVVALAVLVVLCLPWTLGLVRNPVGRAALLLSDAGVSRPELCSWRCLGSGCNFSSAGRRRGTLVPRPASLCRFFGRRRPLSRSLARPSLFICSQRSRRGAPRARSARTCRCFILCTWCRRSSC